MNVGKEHHTTEASGRFSVTMELLRTNMQKFRKKAGITQAKIADLLHYSQEQISSIESGRSVPQVEHLLCYCEILHVTPNELLGFEEKTDKTTIELCIKMLSGLPKKTVDEIISGLRT